MGNSEPLIAIIVPVYNQDKEYLRKCVESVKEQTFRNFRLILVDDGSRDDVAECQDALAEGDARIVSVHQPNAGVAVARNNGLSHTEGADYIVFLDSDDILEPNMLERCLNELEESDADIIACTYSRLVGDKKQSGSYEGPERVVFENDGMVDFLCLSFCSRGVRGIKFPFCACVWAKMFRAELFRDNPNIRFMPGFVYNEDHYLLQRLVPMAKRLVLINEELYIYRSNDNSFVRKLKSDIIDGAVFSFDIMSKELDLSDKKLKQAYDSFRAGYLVVYGTGYLFHPKARLKYSEKRRLIMEAARQHHFVESLGNISPDYFTKGQYVYLLCIRYRFYDVALLAAWFGARQKWKVK